MPCHDADDVGCPLKAIGLAVKVVQSEVVKSAVGDAAGDGVRTVADGLCKRIHNAEQLDAALEKEILNPLRSAFQKELDALAAREQRTGARDWLVAWTERVLTRSPVASNRLLAQSMQSVCEVYRLVAEARKLESHKVDERRAVALELVHATLGIWRGAVAAVVPETDHKRVIAIIDEIHAARTAVSRRDVGAFLVAVNALVNEIGGESFQFDPFPPVLRKYAPLLVDLVSAESAGDVTAALDKYAEPVGGWKAKRERRFGVSLTALIGGAVGVEDGSKTEESDSAPTDLGLGGQVTLFTPVGVDLNHKSWGVLLAPIDIGALTAVRLSGEDTLPTVRLSNVFAPGAFVRYSPWNSPFVVGVGAGIVPGLRSEDPDDIAWRALVFGAVDVTMFSF